MKFIVDAQLPASLSEFLKTRGHDSKHTLEMDQKNRTGDNKIIELAEREDRVVITKDYDFLQSHNVVNKPRKLLLVKPATYAITNYLLFLKHISKKL